MHFSKIGAALVICFPQSEEEDEPQKSPLDSKSNKMLRKIAKFSIGKLLRRTLGIKIDSIYFFVFNSLSSISTIFSPSAMDEKIWCDVMPSDKCPR